MRAMFFHAAAEHPRVAFPLSEQVDRTLRPFDRYLQQSIKAAKQRQVCYKLPFRRARNLRILTLTARDTRLLAPRRAPGWVVANWPVGKAPERGRPLFVPDRDVLIEVESCEPGPLGLVIHAAGALAPGEQVLWCGVRCELAREGEPPRPREVRDVQGKTYRVLRAEDRDERTWLLRVEGRPADGPVFLDGAEVQAERLDDLEDVRWLRDESGRRFEISGGQLKVEELPAGDALEADTGVRFSWHEQDAGRRRGVWVQLLLPKEIDAESSLDPRAAFCEDDVKEVWTAERRGDGEVIKVFRADRESYQLLLERSPEEGRELLLPVNTSNLELQRRALRQLREAPLPHHRGLLRLCEHPEKAHWPRRTPELPERWFFLTDNGRDGTEEQRGFVARALAKPEADIVLLEGPPGSGKTTAICELVRQCIGRGERVLLCASTHVAIDNVLERLIEDEGEPIEALRIGASERVDPKVQQVQIDAKIERLLDAWRRGSAFGDAGDEELQEMAKRTVVMAAHLTCGTTMGIANHPVFHGRDGDRKPWERPIATVPRWDVLIVDEASKTTLQEFMVPALMARRWVIVGDVRQLPPFTERADLLANLRSMTDPDGAELFPADHQRARLLLFRLGNPVFRPAGVRWLLVERPGVLAALERELDAEGRELAVVCVVRRARAARTPTRVRDVTVEELSGGSPKALLLAAADWVLVETSSMAEAAGHLPSNLLSARDLTAGEAALPEAHPLPFRMQAFLARCGEFARPPRDRGKEMATPAELQRHEQRWLTQHDWADEIRWRITRAHELKRSREPEQRERLESEIGQLLPAAVDLDERIAEIEDIGLPSLLEVLQEGIGEERANRPSALTEGIGRRQERAFEERFERLSYQHRMHPGIAAFARDAFYEGSALKDANTLGGRDEALGWDFAPELGVRRVWVDVAGSEKGGVNALEVEMLKRIVRAFAAWAKRKGPPRRDRPRRWELACLCFYVKQEEAIRAMLRDLTRQTDRETRFELENLEIVCGVVDRFQGREADLVLLSMRNARRTGFLDSPNRLNVALTRARQQLVVVGSAHYFGRCGTPELEDLVKKTRKVSPETWPVREGDLTAPRRDGRGPGRER